MSKGGSKSLSELIAASGSPLGKLADEAQRRTALADHLRTGLGTELGSGLAHCNLREDGTLVVLATSPEWAARLRFESAQLIQLCRQQGTPVCAVKVRVAN